MVPGRWLLPLFPKPPDAPMAGVDIRNLSLQIAILLIAVDFVSSTLGWALSARHSPCQMRSTIFEGWKAEELSNDWTRLTILPQLGGRLMQVEFGGHRYLFVNPKYKG